MTIDLNGELAADRFGTPGGSIYFNNGYATVPPGVYFDPATGGFTVMAWMKFVSIDDMMRLIDFALGPGDNNVLVTIYSNNMQIVFYGNGVQHKDFGGNKAITVNQWFHFAASVTANSIIMYIDGIQDVQFTGGISFFVLNNFMLKVIS